MQNLTSLLVAIALVFTAIAVPLTENSRGLEPNGALEQRDASDITFTVDMGNVTLSAADDLNASESAALAKYGFVLKVTEYCQGSEQGSALLAKGLVTIGNNFKEEIYFPSGKINRYLINSVHHLGIGPYDYYTSYYKIYFDTCKWNSFNNQEDGCGYCLSAQDWDRSQPNCALGNQPSRVCILRQQ